MSGLSSTGIAASLAAQTIIATSDAANTRQYGFT